MRENLLFLLLIHQRIALLSLCLCIYIEAAGHPEEGAARLHGGVREAGGRPQEELRGVLAQVQMPGLPRATGTQ